MPMNYAKTTSVMAYLRGCQLGLRGKLGSCEPDEVLPANLKKWFGVDWLDNPGQAGAKWRSILSGALTDVWAYKRIAITEHSFQYLVGAL